MAKGEQQRILNMCNNKKDCECDCVGQKAAANRSTVYSMTASGAGTAALTCGATGNVPGMVASGVVGVVALIAAVIAGEKASKKK